MMPPHRSNSDPSPAQLDLAALMRVQALRGWYTGDEASLLRFGAREVVPSIAEADLVVSLLFSRDRMHHSVGWWRNADYEYCWHLSIGAWEKRAYNAARLLGARTPEWEDLPDDDLRVWASALFRDHAHKAWYEPGGTDPRLSRQEAHGRGRMKHLRVFLEPATLQPFIPKGEVYTLTRWIPGLTPEKVDR